jgi:hypothetical protein
MGIVPNDRVSTEGGQLQNNDVVIGAVGYLLDYVLTGGNKY